MEHILFRRYLSRSRDLCFVGYNDLYCGDMKDDTIWGKILEPGQWLHSSDRQTRDLGRTNRPYGSCFCTCISITSSCVTEVSVHPDHAAKTVTGSVLV